MIKTKILPLTRKNHLLPFKFLIFLWGSTTSLVLVSCIAKPAFKPTPESPPQVKDASTGSRELLTNMELDALIKEREVRTLQSVKNHPYHKNKTLAEQRQLSQVGKTDFQIFLKTLIDFSTASSHDDEYAQNLFAQYKRIWFLADEAYKATRSRKFQPEIMLIPFLCSRLSKDEILHLSRTFERELAKESKDPRALGSECSEMLKLRTIVDTLASQSLKKQFFTRMSPRP
jgi:hypothetical protein